VLEGLPNIGQELTRAVTLLVADCPRVYAPRPLWSRSAMAPDSVFEKDDRYRTKTRGVVLGRDATASRQPFNFAMIAFASAIAFARIFARSSPGAGVVETVIS
jgi:hypothetical protein